MRGDHVPVESRGDLWWKEAVIYCLDVETFADSDGDGVGDFEGLMSRLGYLSSLGVSCIWLMPFYPSPNLDDGYDVADFYGVDERFGTLGDFAELVHHATRRGIHVLIDLVVNHTSDQHRWFQEARRDPSSPYRSYYLWSDEPLETGTDPAFPGESDRTWSFDEVAGQWYLHRFYPFQPELNIADPAVRREIRRIMSFWLQLGVSGFRIDAAAHLLDMTAVPGERADDPHVYIRDLRKFIGRRAGNVMLLGEANVPLYEVPDYFGADGREELDVLFNFRQTESVFLSLATGSADPIRSHLDMLPPVPAAAQWANFLRIHDELALHHLPEHQKAAIYDAFAPEEHMQIYGRGVRRRLGPMLGGDQQRLRFAYSLLLSLPGTPVLLYGDELGMGDNLDIDGRYAVRVPMQWSDGPTGGFSTATAEALVRPTAAPAFGPDQVNVARQRVDPESLLNWVARAIRTRKESPELAWGVFRTIDTGHRDVLVHLSELEGRVLLAVHSFSGEARTLHLGSVADDLVIHGDLLSNRSYDSCDLHAIEIDGLGFRWIATARTEEAPPEEAADEEPTPASPRQASPADEADGADG